MQTSSTTAPRCLLIGDEPLNHVSGSGVTMDSLFGAVAPARRFQIWDHPVLEPKPELAAHFFRQAAPPTPRTKELDDELVRRLASFAPEVIYCSAVSPHLLQLTWEIHRHFRCPLVLHVMDDWPHWDTQHPHPSAACVLKNIWFERLCFAASRCVAISPLMAQEYETQTGLPWEVFHHSVDLEHYVFLEPPLERKILRIGYVGSLRQMFHGDCFEDFLELLAEGGLPEAELTIHTAPHWAVDYQRAFGSQSRIHFAPPVIQEELPQVLAGFDVLFLPFTFRPENHVITRLSLPTKLGEYLAARRPLVMYGPADTAAHHMMESWPAAFAQTTRGKSGLAATFAQAFQARREDHASESTARPALLKAFDRKTVVEAWTHLLRAAAESSFPATSSSRPVSSPVPPSGYLPAHSTWTVPDGTHPGRLEIKLCQTKARVALLSQHDQQSKIAATTPGCFSLPVESSRLEIDFAPAWKPHDLGLPGLADFPPVAGYVRSWHWR